MISLGNESSEGEPHFAVMSPMNERSGEQKVLCRLFENGLSTFHLRRPHWSAGRCKAWVEALPQEWRSRIVLHQHPHLVRKFGLAGFQLSSVGAGFPAPVGALGAISVQCEDYQTMLKVGKHYSRIMLGPVFPPEKYDVTIPRRSLQEYAAMAAYWRKNGGKAQILAFGGISIKNICLCRKAGFDGVVVVGAVWSVTEPVKAFKKLVSKW